MVRVPVFRSSSGSLWPVYIAVTSIKPEDRMKIKQLIVALWHGPPKPVILQPVLDRIQSISSQGILIDGKTLTVFDLPAKATATNTKQFNGKYMVLLLH